MGWILWRLNDYKRKKCSRKLKINNYKIKTQGLKLEDKGKWTLSEVIAKYNEMERREKRKLGDQSRWVDIWIMGVPQKENKTERKEKIKHKKIPQN